MTRSVLIESLTAIGRRTGKGNLLITWNEFRAVVAVAYVTAKVDKSLKDYVSETYKWLKKESYVKAFQGKSGEVCVILRVAEAYEAPVSKRFDKHDIHERA